MFENIKEVEDAYEIIDKKTRHALIYKVFQANIELFPELVDKFKVAPGYGELAFCWNWYILVKEMPNNFKMLEIGVYKGRVLAFVNALAKLHQKNVQLFGITPLSNVGDKYSKYDDDNYSTAISETFNKMVGSTNDLVLIPGLSQDNSVINSAISYSEYDIIFIDGSHDYKDVCFDIQIYTKLLKKGGYLIMDDASSLLEYPGGIFHGHPDVGKAILDTLDNLPNMVHLYAVGHNRVWRKID